MQRSPLSKQQVQANNDPTSNLKNNCPLNVHVDPLIDRIRIVEDTKISFIWIYLYCSKTGKLRVFFYRKILKYNA